MLGMNRLVGCGSGTLIATQHNGIVVVEHDNKLSLRQAHDAEQAEDSVPEGHEDLRHDPQLRQLRERGRFEYGCQHYKRRCRMVAPCCGEVFWCRHCHNKAKNDDEEVRSRCIADTPASPGHMRRAVGPHPCCEPSALPHQHLRARSICQALLRENRAAHADGAYVRRRSPRTGTSWIGSWFVRWCARCAATDSRSRATAAAARSDVRSSCGCCRADAVCSVLAFTCKQYAMSSVCGQGHVNAQVSFGAYGCLRCAFFEDETATRKQFHCEQCGLCRIGGRASFFHCDTCGCCYTVSLKVWLGSQLLSSGC